MAHRFESRLVARQRFLHGQISGFESRDGNDYLIAASTGGADKNPAWFANLEGKPNAKIEVDGKTMSVKVVIAKGDERTELYEKFKSAGSNFVGYEQKTTRKIPVIRLQPTAA